MYVKNVRFPGNALSQEHLFPASEPSHALASEALVSWCMQPVLASDAKSRQAQMHLTLGNDCHQNDSLQLLIKSCQCFKLGVERPRASKCQGLARCSSCQGPDKA